MDPYNYTLKYFVCKTSFKLADFFLRGGIEFEEKRSKFKVNTVHFSDPEGIGGQCPPYIYFDP
jgi:hypothetical protein